MSMDGGGGAVISIGLLRRLNATQYGRCIRGETGRTEVYGERPRRGGTAACCSEQAGCAGSVCRAAAATMPANLRERPCGSSSVVANNPFFVPMCAGSDGLVTECVWQQGENSAAQLQ